VNLPLPALGSVSKPILHKKKKVLKNNKTICINIHMANEQAQNLNGEITCEKLTENT
jgi:hypothetical protein